MEGSPALRFQCSPFPTYISSGKVNYGPIDMHPERVFSTFVAMFIEEGALYFTEGESAYTLTAGQWFIQTPGIRHYGHRASGVKTVFRYVHFLPQAAWRIETDPLLPEQSPRVKQLDSGEGVRSPQFEIALPMRGVYPQPDWQELFEQLHEEQVPGRGALHKQMCFLELLERMVWLDSERKDPSDPIKAVIAYMQRHYAEPLSVAELGGRFHFSPDYLTRRIKQATGMTPSALMLQYRMNKAKHLLVHTNTTVQQISRDSGYNDIAVFSRLFKKHAGQSPTYYRREQWGRSGEKDMD
ncbi:AraC family transcriptional regulator [Paenibacillus mendelii]|uniref:Helix-turn-helix domain-containing protein n=1 Tax=Paenibacillus mendelii TaxID=206163 RepID=A0ABV6JL07_9BACL|nr:AraC family transcriptional regulator [Paenibacillus mendelii]MCQ6560572.1 AraC family transcriptional regulator [Paenibacillus mendelii]